MKVKIVFLLFLSYVSCEPFFIDGSTNMYAIYQPQDYTSIDVDTNDNVALIDDITIFYQNFTIDDIGRIMDKCVGLRVLQLPYCQIQCNLDLSLFVPDVYLKNLNLAGNFIENLAFSGEDSVFALQRLDLSYNRLSSLASFITSNAFSRLPELKMLDLSYNRIMDIDGLADVATGHNIQSVWFDMNLLLSSQAAAEFPIMISSDVNIQKEIEYDCSFYTYKNEMWGGIMCTYPSLAAQQNENEIIQGINTPCCNTFTLAIEEKMVGLQSAINDLYATYDDLYTQGVCHLTDDELDGFYATELDLCCQAAKQYRDDEIAGLEMKMANLQTLLESLNRIGMCDKNYIQCG